jgi:hypothetical protein
VEIGVWRDTCSNHACGVVRVADDALKIVMRGADKEDRAAA